MPSCAQPMDLDNPAAQVQGGTMRVLTSPNIVLDQTLALGILLLAAVLVVGG
jgi:hypothetical protein